jgi:hypothetical protein
MLQLRNRSAAAAAIAVLPDAEGIDTLIVAIKTVRSFDGEAREPSIQPEDRTGEIDGEPVLLLPGDIGLPKPATDVLVSGHVHAPGGSARLCAAGFAVGPVSKRLLVSGDRRWRRRLFGWRASDPEAFERMPLDWRRAVGGAGEERNPLGVGLDAVIDAPLPNLELPDHALRAPTQRPPPAGVGPAAARLPVRGDRAGTYDERWRRERAPYLPDDFDQRFLCCAPPDQVAPGHLTGDEEVALDRLTPAGRESFPLRGERFAVEVRSGRSRQACAPCLDTVLIDADRRELSLLWRASFRCESPQAIDLVDVAATEAA